MASETGPCSCMRKKNLCYWSLVVESSVLILKAEFSSVYFGVFVLLPGILITDMFVAKFSPDIWNLTIFCVMIWVTFPTLCMGLRNAFTSLLEFWNFQPAAPQIPNAHITEYLVKNILAVCPKCICDGCQNVILILLGKRPMIYNLKKFCILQVILELEFLWYIW